MTIEKLQGKRQDVLVVEERIPATHSATPNEHEWHQPKAPIREDVTGKTIHDVFRLAEAALSIALAPGRTDTEYRVVLRSTETTGIVLL